MRTFKYFSYGSNMLVERLQARCPSAKLLGSAKVEGFQLAFSKLSKKDGSGKATPIPHPQNKGTVYGILFEIASDELKDLDRAEGCGYGYDRFDDFVVCFGDDAKKREVTTYLANADYIDPALQPFDWYLALVIAGAHQHNFTTEYIDNLRAVPHLPDTDQKRTSDALQIIKKAGYSSFEELL